MKRIHSFIFILMMGVCFYGCKNDTELLWSPDLAFPVVNAEFQLKDIIVKSKSNIQEDSDGFLTFVYEDTLVSSKAEDLINIPNQEFVFSKSLSQLEISNLQTILTVGQTFTSPEIPFTFDVASSSGFSLDSVLIKSGLFLFDINSDFRHNVALTIKIPGATKNGVVFNETFNLPYVNTVPVVLNTQKSLSDYKFSFNENGNSNKLKIFFSFTFTKVDQSNSESTSDAIDIKINFSDLKFKKIYGKVTSDLAFIPEPDTTVISIFNKAISGGFKVKNPEITTTITNSFGISASGIIDVFKAYNPISNPNPINIEGPGIPNSIQINAPTIEGQSSTTSFTLNKDNSNISDVFFSSPSRLIYKINPSVNVSSTENFALDSSKIKVGIKLTMPMEGAIENFSFVDTVPLKFGRTDRVEYFNFRVNISNGFPIETKLQAYFVTENFVIRDSLIKREEDKIILAAAPVNSNGRVTNSQEKITDIKVSENILGNLSDVTKIIIVAKANTTGAGLTPQQNVKFYSDYKLKVRFGVRAKLKWKISKN